MDTPPPLLGNDDLPGPMCLNLLASSGALCKLDSANAYSCHDSDTLYGRSCIIATLLPSRSVACSRTAAWVWLGGTFPESIDIIAKAHYRALRYGRKINGFQPSRTKRTHHQSRSDHRDHACSHRMRSRIELHPRKRIVGFRNHLHAHAGISFPLQRLHANHAGDEAYSQRATGAQLHSCDRRKKRRI